MRKRACPLALAILPAWACAEQGTLVSPGAVPYGGRSCGRGQSAGRCTRAAATRFGPGPSRSIPPRPARSRPRLAGEAPCRVIAGKNATVGLPYGPVTRGCPGAKQVCAVASGSQSIKGETTPELVRPADTMVETVASIDASPYITEPAS
jgi:hypothetical protein